MKRSAIFFDRDGTIIEDNGYLKNTQEVEFFPDIFTAIKKLQDRFMLFIITNQSGISKGVTTVDEVKTVNNYIVEKFKSEGISITELYCCPHADIDNCDCKKPKPYFIFQAIKLYNLNLTDSYIIGDHPSDVECGRNAGINSIYLLTGHGEKHVNELNDAYQICKNINEAIEYILNK